MLKYFTSPKQRIALRKLFKPFSGNNSLEESFFYGDIQEYTDICFSNAARMQFLGI